MKQINTRTVDIRDSQGLAKDIENMLLRRFDRRRLLGYGVGGSAALLLAGCGGGSDSSNDTSPSTTASVSNNASGSDTSSGTGTSKASCGTIPQETAGPYPADGTNGANALTRSGIVRSDIRSSLNTGNTAAGVALTIILKLVNTNNACAALSGYAIYLWHCDGDGNYSMYSSNVASEDYLRGVQETAANGTVTFSSIFPACYSGRWPHIHFEVFSSLSSATTGRSALRTLQLALPADICSTVYNSVTGYSSSVRNLSQVSLATDNVFSDGYSLQVSSVTGDLTNGYTATLVVGIAV